jgi:hypothetical protein
MPIRFSMKARPFPRVAVAVILLGASFTALPAQSQLNLSPQDIRITQTTEGGYILAVRAAGIGSVLLTESTEHPDNLAATYAFRNPDYHPMNGDERRILDGEFLPRGEGRYSIVDSTPGPDEQFGSAFRLFIPYVVEYGYPWTRNGEIMVLDGTYLSIRTFTLPYADYRGGYQDNPFILRVSQPVPPPPPERPVLPEPEPELEPEPEPDPEPPPPVVPPARVPRRPPPQRPAPQPLAPPPPERPPEPAPEPDLSLYMPLTVETFTEITEATEATLLTADVGEELPGRILQILNRLPEGEIDLVLVIDTTQSMVNSLRVIQKELVPSILEEMERFDRYRIGVVFFRDYFEEYVARPYPFQTTLEGVQKTVDRAQAMGGRDIPEAVYEGLYAGLVRYEWEAPVREIILIGDAPPHPRPRGSITAGMIFETARDLEVRINAIMLPHP